MIVLALDTSSRAASCALLREGRLAGEFFLNTGLTHSQTILPMMRSMLSAAGQDLEQVDRLAVSTGPGSFTGLRIGIAAVKGMALGMGTHPRCAPVSTLEALAENLAAADGWIVPVLDARRDQVYTAVFRAEKGTLTRQSEDGALSLEALRAQILALPPGPVCLAGDGAALAAAAMADQERVRTAPEALLHQRASSVAMAAARMPEDRLCAAGELAPAYLRLPQAERERLARLENRK